jgi:DNA-binding phage protein
MARVALAKVLKRKKVSKRSFAKLAGMHYTNVFKACRPAANPTLRTLEKWARLLGCRVRDLIEE